MPSTLGLARYLAGMTQQDLADASNVARRTIINIEHGKTVPRRSTAAAISRALGFDDPLDLFPEAFGA